MCIFKILQKYDLILAQNDFKSIPSEFFMISKNGHSLVGKCLVLAGGLSPRGKRIWSKSKKESENLNEIQYCHDFSKKIKEVQCLLCMFV